MSGWHSWISIRLQNKWWPVVSSIPTGGNFIFAETFKKTARCQFCTEMSDLCYLRKPQISRLPRLASRRSVLYKFIGTFRWQTCQLCVFREKNSGIIVKSLFTIIPSNLLIVISCLIDEKSWVFMTVTSNKYFSCYLVTLTHLTINTSELRHWVETNLCTSSKLCKI